MTEIKKGDWVYINSKCIGEHVFQCASIASTGNIHDESTHTLWDRKSCHRLTPLEPGGAKVGDRCVVLDNDCLADGDIGDIVNITKVFSDTSIDIQTKNGHNQLIYNHDLARLPDCAQRAPGAPDPDEELPHSSEFKIPATKIVSSIDQWYGTNLVPSEVPWIPLEVLGRKKPTPCPHPEWEGVWVHEYTKAAYKVMWDCHRWQWSVLHVHHGTAQYSASWEGPEAEDWTLIEPAPTASTAGPKLPRPQKHGGVTVPWDPYGEG